MYLAVPDTDGTVIGGSPDFVLAGEEAVDAVGFAVAQGFLALAVKEFERPILSNPHSIVALRHTEDGLFQFELCNRLQSLLR